MKDKFTVKGGYYEVNKYNFRRILEIKRNKVNLTLPDILVVMMNPGSSKPLENQTELLILAKPDNTQLQIMKLMDNCNLNFARILNLSDYREPKSKIFIEIVERLEEENIAHSIFNYCRKAELDSYINTDAILLFSWGVNEKLIPLAKSVTTYFNDKAKFSKIVGIKKRNTDYQFYHPLPRSFEAKEVWLNTITHQIKSLNQLV